jgi:Na+:H+ antiporter, NhaA family
MAIKTIANYLKLEAASGVILFLFALLAVIIDNSPFAGLYEHVLNAPLEIQILNWMIAKPLLFWINEGLMTLFFLLVSLELKREFLEGELSGINKIILPGIAAVGGMVFPALIYIGITYQHSIAMKGWAVPVATDIAFALGVLSLLGKRVPIGLKLFLMALAIFDDIGAIIIIAVVHSHHLSFFSLAAAGVVLLVLIGCNRVGVQRLTPYLMAGVVLWLCILSSGIHATIAGVVLALVVPLRGKTKHAVKPVSHSHGKEKDAVKIASHSHGKEKGAIKPLSHSHGKEKHSIRPLSHLEEHIHPWVAFFVMPLFAFANSGVSLQGLSWSILLDPVPLGVIAGLVIGKQFGVFSLSWFVIRKGWAALPKDANWLSLYGAALLCGIGFTMSLFLGTLAFQNDSSLYLTQVRLGVLLGSMISGVLGAMVLYLTRVQKKRKI